LLTIRSGDPKAIKTDLMLLLVCEDTALYNDAKMLALIDQGRQYPEFSGKSGDEMILYAPAGTKAQRVMLAGLGKAGDVTAESLRRAAGKAVGRAVNADMSGLLICMPEARACGVEPGDAAEALMEGAVLANYRFDFYKKEKLHNALKSIAFAVAKDFAGQARSLAQKTEIVCKGTHMARNWVSMPPNDKRPARFARSIVKAAEKHPLEAVVLDSGDLRKNKMQALLAVAAGSSGRPQMVILDYKPETWDQTVVLVGKGVTFDSGGINLKPASGLETMKQDMAGAAAVAATMIATARTGSGKRVVGVMPLVENMPSGNSYRPGDIVKTASGKSVEIGNTDAEGRMILADALHYAIGQYRPDVVIDMATLTGACVVALGEKIAGVFSTDTDLAEAISQAGQKTHERCWSMPMPEDYRENLKSDFADLKNVGKNRYGGAIAAALFLSEFTKGSRWAHIDIAGPAYAAKGNDYCGPGGTGFGVRLLCRVIENL